MRRMWLLALLTLALAAAGCRGSVNYDDEFSNGEAVYKPESNMEYVKYLSPADSPR